MVKISRPSVLCLLCSSLVPCVQDLDSMIWQAIFLISLNRGELYYTLGQETVWRSSWWPLIAWVNALRRNRPTIHIYVILIRTRLPVSLSLWCVFEHIFTALMSTLIIVLWYELVECNSIVLSTILVGAFALQVPIIILILSIIHTASLWDPGAWPGSWYLLDRLHIGDNFYLWISCIVSYQYLKTFWKTCHRAIVEKKSLSFVHDDRLGDILHNQVRDV